MKYLVILLTIPLFFFSSYSMEMEKPETPVDQKIASPIGRVKSLEKSGQFPMKKPAEEQNTFLAEEEKFWIEKRGVGMRKSAGELAAALLKKSREFATPPSEDSSFSSPESSSPPHKLQVNADDSEES